MQRGCCLLILVLGIVVFTSSGHAGTVSIGCIGGNQQPIVCNDSTLVAGGGEVSNAPSENTYSFQYQDSPKQGNSPPGSRKAEVTYGDGSFASFSQAWGEFRSTPVTSGVTGSLLIDDLTITGPDATVATSVNVKVAGNALFQTSAGTTKSSTTSISLNFGITLDGNHASGTFARTQSKPSHTDDISTSDTVSGLGLQIGNGFSESFNTIVTGDTETVPVGTPISIAINFNVGIQIGGTGSHFSRGDMDMLDTFGLAGIGPVLNLPQGYTANAPGMIDDNRLVSAIPQPAPIAMLGVGLIGLLFGKRRTRPTS